MNANQIKILIIDDEERIGKIYQRMLIEEGFIVRFASGAREATNILIREDIDVVLLDINMPGINGKTVFEIIREYNPNLKVIVVSAYPLHMQKKLIPHAFDYHDKSDNHSNMLEKVWRATKKKEHAH